MAQKHPQRNSLGLLCQYRLVFLIKSLYNLHLLELRAKLLGNISVVKREFALFNELHACDSTNHFGAGGNPEYAVESHWLVSVYASFAGGVGDDFFAILVHCYEDEAGDLGLGIGGRSIDC